MRRGLVPLMAVLLATGAAFAQTPPPQKPCRSVNELNLYDADRPWVRFTTPPYVAVAAWGGLKRLADRIRPTRQAISLAL
ncbi:MAG: hypothetical protein ACE5H5_01345, partial [Nitrospinota bacterium]